MLIAADIAGDIACQTLTAEISTRAQEAIKKPAAAQQGGFSETINATNHSGLFHVEFWRKRSLLNPRFH